QVAPRLLAVVARFAPAKGPAERRVKQLFFGWAPAAGARRIAALLLALARHARRHVRRRLQTLFLDGPAAPLAPPVRAFLDALQCAVDLPQQPVEILLQAQVGLARRQFAPQIRRVLVVQRQLPDAARLRVRQGPLPERPGLPPQPTFLRRQPPPEPLQLAAGARVSSHAPRSFQAAISRPPPSDPPPSGRPGPPYGRDSSMRTIRAISATNSPMTGKFHMATRLSTYRNTAPMMVNPNAMPKPRATPEAKLSHSMRRGRRYSSMSSATLLRSNTVSSPSILRSKFSSNASRSDE